MKEKKTKCICYVFLLLSIATAGSVGLAGIYGVFCSCWLHSVNQMHIAIMKSREGTDAISLVQYNCTTRSTIRQLLHLVIIAIADYENCSDAIIIRAHRGLM